MNDTLSPMFCKELKSFREKRGEARFKAAMAHMEIIKIGKNLMSSFLVFVKANPKLYDQYFKPWLGTIEDVSINTKKRAFRIRIRKLEGDEVTTKYILVPFLLLEDPAAYKIHRMTYLTEKSMLVKEEKDLKGKWRKAVSDGNTTMGFDEWVKSWEGRF